MMNLHLGDCLAVLRTLPDNSIDSIVTDPPYGLSKEPDMMEVMRHWLNGDDYTHTGKGFMGKSWDSFVPGPSVWKECLRVLKPGGHLVAFFGSRTYDMGTLAVRMAGFEIRDQLMWIYSQGFPKSLDVSKQLDLDAKNKWLNVVKSIDNLQIISILDTWKKLCDPAKIAELSFQKSTTETGMNTQKSDSAHAPVVLKVNQENLIVNAVIAELLSSEVLRTQSKNLFSVPSHVANFFTESNAPANNVEHLSASQSVIQNTDVSSVQLSAQASPDESLAAKLRADEALRIWLGSKPSLRTESTSALCAALTDDLKRIILSQSKTFLSLDTTQQTDCASAITVTITESTAESLISFTAATLRNKAIDKAAGAEREVVGSRKKRGLGGSGVLAQDAWTQSQTGVIDLDITAPATDEAAQWQGWGTALKPAHEPIVLARKPLAGTVAQTVLTHGTGAINVDGCRIEKANDDRLDYGVNGDEGDPTANGVCYGQRGRIAYEPQEQGRFPANVLHDGSEEVLKSFDRFGQSSTKRIETPSTCSTDGTTDFHAMRGNRPARGYTDSSNAARFFYCAKADRSDRDEGCRNLVSKQGGMVSNTSGQHITRRDEGYTPSKVKNHHPTVKPTDLMQWLCRLVTPPGGMVLDPYMGSGTTGKAAVKEGFSFTGIELEQEYYDIASTRIHHAHRKYGKQQSLFV